MSTEYIFMEDWDLQAVVRGSGACGDACVDITGNPPSGFQQESLLWSNSSEIFEAAAREVSDDLRELYKPFYPVFHPLSSQTLLASSISLHKEPQDGRQRLQPALPSRSSGMASSDEDGAQAAKSKRSRKNQQKRVVQQVTADGLSSDMWAWRKYGQKPIKGSPYPRSYYRCSSTKGCLARKQVERSRSDPEIFIVTYTAEHNHEQPTRRNSLAGSTRIKSSTPKAPAASDTLLSRDSQTILSPRTSSVTSIEGDLPKQESLKQEEEEQILLADLQGYDIAMPDMMMSDELFPSLEDLDGMFSAELFFNGINCFSD